MYKRTALLLLGLLCCITLPAFGPAQAQYLVQDDYTLTWYVIGGAGQMGMTGNDHAMGATAGQTAIGWAENGHGLGSGFWYVGRWLDFTDIYLPLVIRGYAAP